MIAVIFEVWPKPDKKQNYLDIAAALRPILEHIDGFISIERFESLTEPGKILSLSFFRDEAAVAAWRKTQDHRRAQAAGRTTSLPITGFASHAEAAQNKTSEAQRAPVSNDANEIALGGVTRPAAKEWIMLACCRIADHL